jgi:hypothetical protein
MHEEAEVRDGEESCEADVRNDEVAILAIRYHTWVQRGALVSL